MWLCRGPHPRAPITMPFPLESISEIAEGMQMLTKYGTRPILTMINICCMSEHFFRDDPCPRKTKRSKCQTFQFGGVVCAWRNRNGCVAKVVQYFLLMSWLLEVGC